MNSRVEIHVPTSTDCYFDRRSQELKRLCQTLKISLMKGLTMFQVKFKSVPEPTLLCQTLFQNIGCLTKSFLKKGAKLFQVQESRSILSKVNQRWVQRKQSTPIESTSNALSFDVLLFSRSSIQLVLRSETKLDKIKPLGTVKTRGSDMKDWLLGTLFKMTLKSSPLFKWWSWMFMSSKNCQSDQVKLSTYLVKS